MKQIELLSVGRELLKQNNISNAEIKAKMLLEFILKQSREKFVKNSMEKVLQIQEQEYIEKLKQVVQGKPLQYITHNQKFMGLDFFVDENVLIPQPDTEILVEQAINIITKINNNWNECVNKSKVEKNIEADNNNITSKENIGLQQKEITLLDLCTGSGAIAVSIAKYAQNEYLKGNTLTDYYNQNKQNEQIENNGLKVKIIASDISNEAIEIARKNAVQNKVDKQIELIKSDMFSNLTNYKFDVIASNPPYIETSTIQTLDKEVQQEPTLALDGGKDGLEFYRIILKNAEKYLKPNGYVLLEIGYNQGEKVYNLLEKLKIENKCKLKVLTKNPIQDFGGNDRVVIFYVGTKI